MIGCRDLVAVVGKIPDVVQRHRIGRRIRQIVDQCRVGPGAAVGEEKLGRGTAIHDRVRVAELARRIEYRRGVHESRLPIKAVGLDRCGRRAAGIGIIHHALHGQRARTGQVDDGNVGRAFPPPAGDQQRAAVLDAEGRAVAGAELGARARVAIGRRDAWRGNAAGGQGAADDFDPRRPGVRQLHAGVVQLIGHQSKVLRIVAADLAAVDVDARAGLVGVVDADEVPGGHRKIACRFAINRDVLQHDVAFRPQVEHRPTDGAGPEQGRLMAPGVRVADDLYVGAVGHDDRLGHRVVAVGNVDNRSLIAAIGVVIGHGRVDGVLDGCACIAVGGGVDYHGVADHQGQERRRCRRRAADPRQVHPCLVVDFQQPSTSRHGRPTVRKLVANRQQLAGREVEFPLISAMFENDRRGSRAEDIVPHRQRREVVELDGRGGRVQNGVVLESQVAGASILAVFTEEPRRAAGEAALHQVWTIAVADPHVRRGRVIEDRPLDHEIARAAGARVVDGDGVVAERGVPDPPVEAVGIVQLNAGPIGEELASFDGDFGSRPGRISTLDTDGGVPEDIVGNGAAGVEIAAGHKPTGDEDRAGGRTAFQSQAVHLPLLHAQDRNHCPPGGAGPNDAGRRRIGADQAGARPAGRDVEVERGANLVGSGRKIDIGRIARGIPVLTIGGVQGGLDGRRVVMHPVAVGIVRRRLDVDPPGQRAVELGRQHRTGLENLKRQPSHPLAARRMPLSFEELTLLRERSR